MTLDPELRRARVSGLFALLGLLAVLLVRVPGASAALPTNGRIAYSGDQGGDNEIYVSQPDGSGRVKLTDNNAWDTEPAMSPDGTRIAFSSDRDDTDDIWVMAADGSNQFNITGNESGGDSQPDWSPDGSKIAFLRDGEIFVVAADGSSPSVLLKPGHAPAWSPDGTQIAFIRPADSEGDIYVMDANGTNVVRLTTGLEADSPTWSPNGRRIAFEAVDPDDRGNFHIFSTTAAGDDLTRLTDDENGQDFDPDYSPDGKKLVFTRLAVDTDLYVSNPDGSGAASITPAGTYEFLASWGGCEGCSTPTPDPSDTSSPSPSPSPSPTATEEPRLPTQLSLNVVKSGRRLKAAGHLDPAHPGFSITATLSKRQGVRWKRVTRKTVVMNGDSYRVALARPPKGRSCRVKVSFAGDQDHLPSSRSKKTRC
ncbi:MAG: TolB protein [Actinomycetota bacterium]|jgi:Tol biopolymer transport system component|nr:TolB protein [Actinomycetota bacterium]